jgi:hypothetical protein
MVRDLFPLALWGVEHHSHHLLAVSVVARDVEEFRVVRGMWCPSRWMREVHVVPF